MPAPRAVRQTGQHVQPLAQLGDRFRHRRARQRLLTGLQPISDRLFRQPGRRAVLRQQRGLRQHDLRKAVFEGRGNAGVQPLAPAAQQGAVGRILHQRVLEDVAGFRRRAADEQQAGVGQPIERLAKLRLRQIGDGRQQSVAELAADRRAGLRDVLGGRSQPVQPRHQRGVQGRRHRQRRMRHGGQRCRALRAGFEHRLGQFLDEQRHAVGALGDLLHDLGWQRRIPGDVCDHRRRVAPVEPCQRQHRHMRLPGPRRLKFGAEHGQQQHRPVRDPLYHAVQQFARTRVDPVKVIEHHQHRLLPRKTFNLPQQRLERLLLLALRREIERRREIG